MCRMIGKGYAIHNQLYVIITSGDEAVGTFWMMSAQTEISAGDSFKFHKSYFAVRQYYSLTLCNCVFCKEKML